MNEYCDKSPCKIHLQILLEGFIIIKCLHFFVLLDKILQIWLIGKPNKLNESLQVILTFFFSWFKFLFYMFELVFFYCDKISQLCKFKSS